MTARIRSVLGAATLSPFLVGATLHGDIAKLSAAGVWLLITIAVGGMFVIGDVLAARLRSSVLWALAFAGLVLSVGQVGYLAYENDRELKRVQHELERQKAELRLGAKPNQSPEPTPTAGTSAAEQPLVPAAVVAHL